MIRNKQLFDVLCFYYKNNHFESFLWSPRRSWLKPYAYFDFDQDGLIEFVTFNSKWSKSENGVGTESEISFHIYELTKKIGTGPNYSKDTAEKGAPGFNEQYYLNEN